MQIPIDGIVQDWQYWGCNHFWNAADFLADGFQDAPRWIDSIHAADAHLMITVWSSFGPFTKGYAQLDSIGQLLDFRTWPSSGSSHWPPRMDYPSGVRCYNPFSTAARDIYWGQIQNLLQKGVDAWWMDSTEPDNEDFDDKDFDRLVGENPEDHITMRRMRNAYPLACVSGVYNHQRVCTDSTRVFIMTRSGFAGSQRYAASLWSGDITSSWQTLRAQIPAGINFSLTGNPGFNSDIGGFFAGAYNTEQHPAYENPVYKELYTRWMQYGMLCPIFRSHGTDVARELWLYGEPGQPIFDALKQTIRLRYVLLPYLYTLAHNVTAHAQSYIRPLFADFPLDTATLNNTTQFMLGKSILCAPIVHAQYTTEQQTYIEDRIDFMQPKQTTVYLPAGADWFDFHTDSLYTGGTHVTLNTDITSIPMFVRAGSIILLAPPAQHTPATATWPELTMRIYPGADAQTTLYEDEGDNYNYEKGFYTEIPIRWNNRTRTITVMPAIGQPSIPHTFHIRLADGTQQTIHYNGKKISAHF